MSKNESTRILIDQITEGQVTWAPMDREYDHVSKMLIIFDRHIPFTDTLSIRTHCDALPYCSLNMNQSMLLHC